MNLKDKAFLEKFCVILRLWSFPLRAGWGSTPLINQKMTKYLPRAFQLESEGSQIKPH